MFESWRDQITGVIMAQVHRPKITRYGAMHDLKALRLARGLCGRDQPSLRAG